MSLSSCEHSPTLGPLFLAGFGGAFVGALTTTTVFWNLGLLRCGQCLGVLGDRRRRTQGVDKDKPRIILVNDCSGGAASCPVQQPEKE